MRARLDRPGRRAAVTLALCASAAAVTTTARAEPRRLAVVIGNNTGHGDDMPLKYAERDASRVAAVMQELGHFATVKVLLGRGAPDALAALEETRRIARDRRAAGDQLLLAFFYSGHGDQQGLRMGATLLDYTALLAELRSIPSDVRVVIVDACEAGAITRGKGLKPGPPVNVRLVDSLGTTGEAIIASTSQTEAAQESDLLRGSLFTSHLLTGLRGAADGNADGVIGLREVYQYAHDRTVAGTVVSAAGMQRPTYAMRLEGSSDVALAWPGRSQAFLQFRARSAGHFLVLSHDEALVLAEVATTPGVAQRIALPAATYWVKKRGTTGVLMARAQLEDGMDAILDESQMAQIPYATLAEKGKRLPSLFTLGASLATGPPTADSSLSSMGLQLGYVLNYDSFALWGTFGVAIAEPKVFEAGPGLALLWRTPRPRWEFFYGPAANVLYYLRSDREGNDDQALGLGVDGITGISMWAGEHLAFTAHVELGVRLAGGASPAARAGLSVGTRFRF